MSVFLKGHWLRVALFALVLLSSALVLQFSKALENLDNAIYDAFIPGISTPPTSDIVIIAIDEQSLEEIGRWPWSRKLHARMIDRLNAAGVKAIGLNIIFAEPENDEAADKALVDAIARHQQVVVASTYEHSANGLRFTPLIPGLTDAAVLGHTGLSLQNGVVRGVYLVAGIGTTRLPAFALALQQFTQKFSAAELPGTRNPNVTATGEGRWVRDYHIMFPFTASGRIARYSFANVLADSFDINRLRDKTVLIGATAMGLGDSFSTPVSADGALMSGVEIQANLLNALRHGRVITPLSSLSSSLIGLAWLLFAVLIYPCLSARQAMLFATVLFVLPLLLSIFLLQVFMLWFAPAVILVCVILSYPFWAASRLERMVRELFSERERSKVTLNSIGDGVVTIDTNRRVEYLNGAAESMAMYAAEQAIGLPIESVFNIAEESQRSAFSKAMAQCFNKLEVVRVAQGINFITPTHTLITSANLAPLRDKQGLVTGIVIGLSDVTDNIKTSQQLAFQATHDALTKLPNRSLLLDRLDLAIKRARRNNDMIAVLFIDLDRFKNINDALGHPSGDALLKAVAERLQFSARQGDTVSRLGGDEFVILVEGLSDLRAATAVAYKLLDMADLAYQIDGHELFVSYSIGISLFPKDGKNANMLLKHADTAMYQAKAQGRNALQFYSPEMNYRTLERLKIENGLRYALQNHEFNLYYQPQINARTGRVVGLEALLRWQKNGEIVHTPDQFIPVAEDTGFIQALGEWVLTNACQQFSRWRKMGLPAIFIAVNVSPRQLYNQEFVSSIKNILSSTGMLPEYLDIEITERTIMKDVKRAAELLAEIRAIGCSVSIDDFGTGYSSLSYLKQLPVTALKIDQSFVADIDQDGEDKAITQAIITMAHGLGMRVIAEGVETRRQRNVLALQGCDDFQGFYFSEAQSVEKITVQLQQNAKDVSVS